MSLMKEPIIELRKHRVIQQQIQPKSMGHNY